LDIVINGHEGGSRLVEDKDVCIGEAVDSFTGIKDLHRALLIAFNCLYQGADIRMQQFGYNGYIGLFIDDFNGQCAFVIRGIPFVLQRGKGYPDILYAYFRGFDERVYVCAFPGRGKMKQFGMHLPVINRNPKSCRYFLFPGIGDIGFYRKLVIEEGIFITVCLIDPKVSVDLAELGRTLEAVGRVDVNDFLVRCTSPPYELTVFSDGRAIVRGTEEPSVARSVYSRLVGM
jgi:hypothetical protein